MTKADLIEEVSRVVEMTRRESEVIVEAIFDTIVRSLRKADKTEIRGFGSFRTRQRQARIMVRVGRALEESQKYDDAIRWFDKAIASPDSDAQLKDVAAKDKARVTAKKARS